MESETVYDPPPPLELYCINLDHRTDRWADTQAAFAAIGTTLQRFPACTAARGVDGCRASHFAVVRMAAERGLPWVGVLEDDCEPYAHFAEEFPKLLTVAWAHREAWDICNTGPIAITSCSRVVDNLIEIPKCICLQFVIIHAGAYDKILSSWTAGESPEEVDEYYTRILRTVTWAPPLTYQRNSRSDIRPGTPVGGSEQFQETYLFLSRMRAQEQTQKKNDY
jgi:hypothetical protein